MAIKVKTKLEQIAIQEAPINPLRIPAITGAIPYTQNIIIRAAKIMLMDIRMMIHPKQTREDMEKYSQFSDLVYRK